MQPEHANGASSTPAIGQSIGTTPVAEEDEIPSGDVTTSEKEKSGGATPITNPSPLSLPPKDAETIQSPGMRPGRPMGIGNVHLEFSTPEARAQSVEALAALDAARKERVRLWLAARNSAGPAGTTEEDLGDIFDIENGEPIYVGVFNAVAGFSSNVGWLQDRTLKGRDMVIGVWDGGNPRVTHVEFGDRVRYRDTVNTALNQHATHVIGTIAAEGKDRSAMGMAPAATVEAYSFNGDVMGTLGRRGAASAEQAIDTSLSPQNRLIMVSNHSWGPIMGWNRPRPPTTFTWNWVAPPNPGPQTDSGNFGIYDSSTQNLDVLCAVQPYHLPIFAVGNDRSNNPQEGDSLRVTRQGLPVIENYSPAIHPTGDGLRVDTGRRVAD